MTYGKEGKSYPKSGRKRTEIRESTLSKVDFTGGGQVTVTYGSVGDLGLAHRGRVSDKDDSVE